MKKKEFFERDDVYVFRPQMIVGHLALWSLTAALQWRSLEKYACSARDMEIFDKSRGKNDMLTLGIS